MISSVAVAEELKSALISSVSLSIEADLTRYPPLIMRDTGLKGVTEGASPATRRSGTQ